MHGAGEVLNIGFCRDAFMLLTNILVTIVLFLFLYVSFVLCIHTITSCIEEVTKRQRNVLPEHIILPIILQTNKNADRCSICLEQLSAQPVGMLPCRHMFHVTCIQQWKQYNCPVCRAASNMV